MNTIALQNTSLSTRVQEALEEERRQSAEDRQKLMTQMSSLFNAQAEAQEARLADRVALIQKSVGESNTSMESAMTQYSQGMENWDNKENVLMEDVKKSREQLKNKLKDDWTTASDQSTAIQNVAKSIHAETARVAEEQTDDLDSQMEALDDFVSRAKLENTSHHESHNQFLQSLSNTVEQSFGNMSAHFKTSFERIKNLGEGMELDTNDLKDGLEPLESQLCQPLANLRQGIAATSLQEYQPTGETPQKATYHYPTKLPRTEPHEVIVAKMDEDPASASLLVGDDSMDSSAVFLAAEHKSSPITKRQSSASTSISVNTDGGSIGTSLREVNPNVSSTSTTGGGGGTLAFDPRASTTSMPPEHAMPSFKKPTSRLSRAIAKPSVVMEGRENMMVATYEPSSLSRRKSPRLN
ncbi:hypothetical protein E4U54_001634 [Claviceps lovelessii]|nr:hypothetical protein E4U54_001634 [Claviceps lovelessii]